MKKIIIAETILKTVGSSDTLFGRGGIVMLQARTSEDVLAVHRRRRADLIIADFSLPVMNGAELCAAIRSDESLKGVSIILACDETQEALQACSNAGANAVIVKPIDAFSLFTKMSELLVVPQRKDMRVLMRVSVNGGRGSSPFFATSENISISGMLFETNYRFKRGDQITCSFFVGHSNVSIDGTIMRVDPASSGMSRYGVRFLNPPTKALVVIEQFVKRQKKSETGAK
jgi:CheY-like chemotaxis protein